MQWSIMNIILIKAIWFEKKINIHNTLYQHLYTKPTNNTTTH